MRPAAWWMTPSYTPLSEGRYFVVLNVGKGERIAESLRAWAASEGKSVTIRDPPGHTASFDLQGPATVRVMTKLLKDPEAVFDKLPLFLLQGDIELADSDIFLADGTPIFLSRTGYTGEQGFEIFVPYDKIVDIWNRFPEAGEGRRRHPLWPGRPRLRACRGGAPAFATGHRPVGIRE